MEEEQNIPEESQQEANDELQAVNRETLNVKSTLQEQTQPQTENSKLQTEEMEVHHHPHVAKKNFKEYFLEFLMIFLAVTMGFFAENLREHFTDSATEKSYMRSMTDDLKQDTANINAIIYRNANILKGMDTLITYLSKPLTDKNNVNLVYAYILKYRFYTPEVAFSEGTITQLKNNGGLRLIKKQKVAYALSGYDEGITGCNRQRDMVIHYYQVCDESEINIFDFAPVKPLYDLFPKINVDTLSIQTILLYTKNKVNLKNNDPVQVTKYINALMYEQATVGLYIYVDLMNQRNSAIALIKLIQKEYNLQK